MAAVSREPLRESGYRVLMKAHLAEGNTWEAVRCYDQYSAIAARELGIGPSAQMRALLAHVKSYARSSLSVLTVR